MSESLKQDFKLLRDMCEIGHDSVHFGAKSATVLAITMLKIMIDKIKADADKALLDVCKAYYGQAASDTIVEAYGQFQNDLKRQVFSRELNSGPEGRVFVRIHLAAEEANGSYEFPVWLDDEEIAHIQAVRLGRLNPVKH